MGNQTIYDKIEQNIIGQLENGIIPWRKCYHVNNGAFAISHQSGQMYGLLNQFLLSEPGEYWTFNQARKEGYGIRKGAKSRKIYFWKVINTTEVTKDEDGDFLVKMGRTIPMLKEYSVFHESDVDGLPPKPINESEDEMNKNVIDAAELIVNNYAQNNKWLSIINNDRAIPCYIPTEKLIKMPLKCQFDSIEEYYSSLFHEMTHSTKFPLERKNDNYAREELVAELGSAFLCGRAGISEDKVIQNQSSYCMSWLQALKGNIKNLVWASSRAEAAVHYIINNEIPKKEIPND